MGGGVEPSWCIHVQVVGTTIPKLPRMPGDHIILNLWDASARNSHIRRSLPFDSLTVIGDAIGTSRSDCYLPSKYSEEKHGMKATPSVPQKQNREFGCIYLQYIFRNIYISDKIMKWT
jgi:hypothetical protein